MRSAASSFGWSRRNVRCAEAGTGNRHQGQRECLDVELEADCCDDPARCCGAQIGAENDADRAGQRDNAGTDEGEDDQADDGAALQDGSSKGTGQYALDRMLRMFLKDLLERPASKLLQRQFQLMHAEEKQAQACQQAPCIDIFDHWIDSKGISLFSQSRSESQMAVHR